MTTDVGQRFSKSGQELFLDLLGEGTYQPDRRWSLLNPQSDNRRQLVDQGDGTRR